jgi:hypothetical protein
MVTSNNGGSVWAAPIAAPDNTAGAPDGWEATRAQTAVATQFLKDERDYLDGEQPDIGKQVGADARELFVSCDPAQAMRQQFEHLHPEYIAVHDLGTTTSRKLLASIAAASKRHVQTLTIRRQGYGTTLATLEFIELPTSEGTLLRIYTTETDADTSARHGLATTLLAFSRLGVVLVGEMPHHALAAAFKPVHEDMIRGPWPNRHLLLLPLASANALVSQGVELSRGTHVNVRTTPTVARPADAWGFISSTWSRVREPVQAQAKAPAPRPPAAPLPLRPMPEVRAAASQAVLSESVLERYVQHLSHLAGMVSCCIFDIASGRALNHAGANPGASDLAEHGTEMLSSMQASSRSLGLGHAIPEAAITLGAHHLVLRAVPRHPGLALHAVLDKTHANLTLARLQIQRMDSLFDA